MLRARIRETKTSPPRASSTLSSTRFTASRVFITKRVMSGSVTVTGPPAAICRRKSGKTEPCDPSTLPNRVEEKITDEASALGGAHEPFAHELACAHDVGGVHGLVGTGEQHLAHPRGPGGGDDVGDAEHIGFDGLCRRKLAGGNMLEGRRVNNGIHACEQRFQPTFVTHIAKDKGERPE